MDAAPHRWYALHDLPCADYSGMEVNVKHTEHAFWVDDVFVPQTLKQAKSCPDSMLWEKAMNEELESLSSNDTFTICKLPKGCKAVYAKWVYTIKSDGQYKAHLLCGVYTSSWG